MATREPVFNLSERFVLLVSGVVTAIWVACLVLPSGLVYEVDRISVLRPVEELRGAEFASLLFHGLRHVDLSHLVLNIVGVLWFGTLTLKGARAFTIRNRVPVSAEQAFIAVMVAGILCGGLAQLAWWAATHTVSQEMVGLSGGVSALLATGIYAYSGRVIMLRFAVIWAGMNLLMVAFPEIVGANHGWPAHIGGYLAGMGLAARCIHPRAAES